MFPSVFALMNGHVSGLENRNDVRFLKYTKKDGFEKRTQVKCDLDEVENSVPGVTTYEVKIPDFVPEDAKPWLVLQLVERGEENLAQVVTNREGRKLDPRHIMSRRVGKTGDTKRTGTVLFSTAKGELLTVEVSTARCVGHVRAYRFTPEGTGFLLWEEWIAKCKISVDIQDGKESLQIRWDSDSFEWLNKEPKGWRDGILRNFEAAVKAAFTKAEHNCYRIGCEPHYALTPEEAKAFRKEIREAKNKTWRREPAPQEASETSDEEQIAAA